MSLDDIEKEIMNEINIDLTDEEKYAISEAGASILVEKTRSRMRYSKGYSKGNVKDEVISENDESSVGTTRVGWTSDGFYGRMVEEGTENMEAQPVLRPALEESIEEIQNAMISKLEEKI